jgi:translation initiation factor 2 beta subunit (eIF-2beta)/eIF-5
MDEGWSSIATKTTESPHTHGKQNNALLSNNLVKEEIKKEIKDFLAFYKNECTICPNLWDTIKAVLIGKLIALSTSKMKVEIENTISLTANLKALEQKRSKYSQEE